MFTKALSLKILNDVQMQYFIPGLEVVVSFVGFVGLPVVKGNVVGTCVASAVVGTIVDGETLEEGVANSDISITVENMINDDNLPPQNDFYYYILKTQDPNQEQQNKFNSSTRVEQNDRFFCLVLQVSKLQ